MEQTTGVSMTTPSSISTCWTSVPVASSRRMSSSPPVVMPSTPVALSVSVPPVREMPVVEKSKIRGAEAPEKSMRSRSVVDGSLTASCPSRS